MVAQGICRLPPRRSDSSFSSSRSCTGAARTGRSCPQLSQQPRSHSRRLAWSQASRSGPLQGWSYSRHIRLRWRSYRGLPRGSEARTRGPRTCALGRQREDRGGCGGWELRHEANLSPPGWGEEKKTSSSAPLEPAKRQRGRTLGAQGAGVSVRFKASGALRGSAPIAPGTRARGPGPVATGWRRRRSRRDDDPGPVRPCPVRPAGPADGGAWVAPGGAERCGAIGGSGRGGSGPRLRAAGAGPGARRPGA